MVLASLLGGWLVVDACFWFGGFRLTFGCLRIRLLL